MQIWTAGCLQDSSGWPHLPQPKHVNLLCVLNNPLCKWHMGPSCKSHHSKDNLKQKGSLISDVKEGKNHTCRDEGRGAISGVGHPVWCGGLGAPFICTLLTSSVFFLRKVPAWGEGVTHKVGNNSLWCSVSQGETVRVSHCLWNYSAFSVMYIIWREYVIPEPGT